MISLKSRVCVIQLHCNIYCNMPTLKNAWVPWCGPYKLVDSRGKIFVVKRFDSSLSGSSTRGATSDTFSSSPCHSFIILSQNSSLRCRKTLLFVKAVLHSCVDLFTFALLRLVSEITLLHPDTGSCCSKCLQG